VAASAKKSTLVGFSTWFDFQLLQYYWHFSDLANVRFAPIVLKKSAN